MLTGARVAGVVRGDCVLGVAGADPPGECVATMLPPEIRLLDEPGPDATDADRFLHLGSVLAAHDLLESHWHVGPVGVEPGFQGMGLGGAAMKLLCGEFDEHGRLAWLETDKPENVRFYIGHGLRGRGGDPVAVGPQLVHAPRPEVTAPSRAQAFLPDFFSAFFTLPYPFSMADMMMASKSLSVSTAGVPIDDERQ